MENEKKKNFSNELQKLAFTSLSVGIISLLISIIIKILSHHNDTKNIFLVWLTEFFEILLSHLGIGLIILSIVSFLLEIPHWTHYFENRLKNLIINKSYLSKLNENDLLELQSNIMQTYFHNDNIGNSGSFLNYYQENIQSIIGMAYRENVSMNLDITEHSDNLIKIHETLTFVCRMNSKSIHKEISYKPEKNEHYETLDFNVTIHHLKLAEKNNEKSETKVFDYEYLKTNGHINQEGNGFVLPINEYNHDKLTVTLNATYLIHESRVFNWVVADPTNGATLNISYPKKYELIREYFFNSEKNYLETIDDNNNHFCMSNNGWLIPGEGISLQVLKKNFHQKKITISNEIEPIKE